MSSEMEVRLVEQPRGPFKIVVYIRSNVRREIRSLGELNPAVASGSDDLIKRVGLLAAIVAEHQCRSYNDNHDVKDCYRVATELFREAIITYAERQPELKAAVHTILGDPEAYSGQTAHVSAKTH